MRLTYDAGGPVTVTCERCRGTSVIDAASPYVTQVASFITGHPCAHVIVLPGAPAT